MLVWVSRQASLHYIILYSKSSTTYIWIPSALLQREQREGERAVRGVHQGGHTGGPGRRSHHQGRNTLPPPFRIKKFSIPDPNFSVPDPNFSVPDPNFFHPGSQIRIKELSIFTWKIVSKLLELWSGLFIPDPDPGSRVQKGTGSRIRIRNTASGSFPTGESFVGSPNSVNV